MNEFIPQPGEIVLWDFKNGEVPERFKGTKIDNVANKGMAKVGTFSIHAITSGIYYFVIAELEMKPFDDSKAYKKWTDI
jgi:hypothetical protein